MKKINSLLFFSLCFFLSQAQISLTYSNMPTLPWIDAQQKDTLTSRVINTNWGAKGANQIYDFSGFHNTALDSTYYQAPTGTQSSNVPNANFTVTNDHVTYLMGNMSANNLLFDGLQTVAFGVTLTSNYTQLDTDYKFPTVYGQNFRGTYGGYTKVKASAISSYASLLGWDSVKIVNSTTYTDTIDGWGIVKTPVGTYNCLRQHRLEVSTTTIYYNTSNGGSYTQMPTSEYGQQILASNPIVSTSNYYYYLTKETHGSVISFTYDSINQPLTASWSTVLPYPVADFGYTTGANGQVTFSDSSTGAPLTYSWNFGDGNTSTSASPTHTYGADGTYYVCLTVTNTSGDSTYCDSVTVTNAPVAPIAQITPSGHDTICPGASVVLRAQTSSGYTFKWSSAGNPTADSIIVATGGSYTVTVYNGTDSAVSAPTTVVVASTPSAAVTLSGASTFCQGDSVVLTAPSGLTYSWNTTATTQNITVYTAGNYSVTVTNSNGCIAVSTPQSTTVNIPAADTISQSGYVLTSLAESSYQWYLGSNPLSGATSQTYTATQNGVYTVDITDANGCSSVSNSITVTGVGINEITASQYRIYPNPASDVIQLDLTHMNASAMSGLTGIAVYDMLGEKIKSQPISQTSISVRDLSNGVYIIAVTDNNDNRKVLGKFEVVR